MKCKKKVGRKRISFEVAEEIRRLVAAGLTLREVAEKHGISIPYASLIARGLRKKRKAVHVST